MAGVINDGDEFLIDLDQTKVIDADLFALIVNSRIWVRWIRPEIDGTFTLAAQDSERFPSQCLTADQLASLDIIGRVAMTCRYR
ncbi:putative HTH-type transcriptional regulator [compost metagenome]